MLIDTHILLWFQSTREKLTKTQQDSITNSQRANQLFLSAVSLWEIALLKKAGRITLTQPFDIWLEHTRASVKIIDVNADIAVESVNLPNCDHKDPADRFIIATARILNCQLMTYDQKIIDYAKHGHIRLA